MVATTTRSQLHGCLNDVDYPASKDDLLAAAARNQCDQDTVRALRIIPPETYRNFSEVLASVPLAEDRLSDAERAVAHRVRKPRLADSAKDVPPPSPIIEELGENPKD